MSETNVAIRLKHFMESKEIAITQFADMCGIPRPSLSQLLRGRNKKLSDVIVKQIHDRFPELSVLWLMFGEGEMLVPAPINPALVSEAEKFMDENVGEDSEPALAALNAATAASNYAVLREVSNKNKHVAEEPNAAVKPVAPRKVRSITVFYDDNSYEVFYPDKK